MRPASLRAIPGASGAPTARRSTIVDWGRKGVTLINQHSIEEFALEDTRKQWKLEVEWLELDRHQLMMQVAALHEQISELRAVHGHK